MPKKYDIAVVVGTYDKDGETRKRWKNIGEVHQGDKGLYAILDPFFNLAALPRKEGSDRVMASLFEPREGKRDSYKPPARPQIEVVQGNDFDDFEKLPF